MLHSSKSDHGGAPALEASAALAGMALACTYANSAEFDAALIADRRAAGVYGPRRYRHRIVAAAAMIAALATIAFVIII